MCKILLVLSLAVVVCRAQLFPKYKPGDVLEGVAVREVDTALDHVKKAAKVSNSRLVAFGLASESGHFLHSPRLYIKSGQLSEDFPTIVEPGRTALNMIVNGEWETSGTEGLVSYTLGDTGFQVVLMWSNPYVQNLRFNVKVYRLSYDLGEHMFNQMYTLAGPWKPSGWDDRNEYGVTIRATMTSNVKAKIMVFVDSSAFDVYGDLDSYVDCSFKPSWFGSYCWRECHSGGWCWINMRCSNSEDCQGPHPCYEHCEETP